MKLLIMQRDMSVSDPPSAQTHYITRCGFSDTRNLNELSFVEFQSRLEVSVRAGGSRDDFPVVVLTGQYFPDLKQEVY
jgi:hypothetical protein